MFDTYAIMFHIQYIHFFWLFADSLKSFYHHKDVLKLFSKFVFKLVLEYDMGDLWSLGMYVTSLVCMI